MSIFISYRRRDAAFAGRVRDRLEMAFPKEVFLDVYGIGLAVDFERTIEAAIAKSRVVVVLIGKEWLFNSDQSRRLGDAEDNVTLELIAALKQGVPLVPVLIDSAPLPRPENLPNRLGELLKYNAMHVRHDAFEEDMERLIEPLREAMGMRRVTPLERGLAFLADPFGHQRLRVTERFRATLAWTTLAIGVFMLVFAAGNVLTGMPATLFDFFVIAVGLVIAFLSWKNSARRRRAAQFGLGLGCLAVLAATGNWFYWIRNPSAMPLLATEGSARPLWLLGWECVGEVPKTVRDWDRELILNCDQFQFDQHRVRLSITRAGGNIAHEYFETKVPKVMRADGAYYLVIIYDLFDRTDQPDVARITIQRLVI
jgi:TIR domain